MLLNDSVREELLWNNKTMTEKELDILLHKLHVYHYRDDFRLPYQRGSALASSWEHYFHEETMSFFY